MNKFYIVEEIGFDKKFKTEEEIEDLNFKRIMQSVFGTLKAKPMMRVLNSLMRFKLYGSLSFSLILKIAPPLTAFK